MLNARAATLVVAGIMIGAVARDFLVPAMEARQAQSSRATPTYQFRSLTIDEAGTFSWWVYQVSNTGGVRVVSDAKKFTIDLRRATMTDGSFVASFNMAESLMLQDFLAPIFVYARKSTAWYEAEKMKFLNIPEPDAPSDTPAPPPSRRPQP